MLCIFYHNFLKIEGLQVQALKTYLEDLPGGLVIKNPFCNPEDTGSISGWGTKIPHALAPQLESP